LDKIAMNQEENFVAVLGPTIKASKQCFFIWHICGYLVYSLCMHLH